MVKCSIDFSCMLCGHKDFYISPVGKKTISNDIVYSMHEYKLVCKKCRKTYVLDFKIIAV